MITEHSKEKKRSKKLMDTTLNPFDTCLRLQLIKKAIKTIVKQLSNKLN